MARRACDVVALRRLAHLAVALTAFRAKQGTYPGRLAAPVPTFLDHVPTDPWDWRRLRMNARGTEVVLFTARNGTISPKISPDAEGHRRDVVFRLR
jgi:hypothetical protein